MDEFVCRIEAGMQEDGSVAVHITGSPRNMVQCLGGLVKAVADFSEVSPVQLALDALVCSGQTAMVGKTVVPQEVYKAARKWKERKDEGTD